MAGSPMLPQKRMRPDSDTHPRLTDNEHKIYELIKSKTNTGMWTADIKKETGLQQPAVTKALNGLRTKTLIKDVVSIRNKSKKTVMAIEFEPSTEISGGEWYTNGNLDSELITVLRDLCLKQVQRLKVATVEKLYELIRGSNVCECTKKQIQEIVDTMVLDKELQECKSNGMGEFSHVRIGEKCYRSLKNIEGRKEGTLSSIPCGVCPRINECTPDGIISPKVCVYYNKWLGIEF